MPKTVQFNRAVQEFRIGDSVAVIPAFSFADYGMYGELVNASQHAGKIVLGG